MCHLFTSGAHDRHDRSDRHDVFDDERVRDREQRAFLEQASRFGTIVLICVGIWLLGGAGYFWPGWVILFCGLKLGARARDLYSSPLGPEPDDDAEPRRQSVSY